jgi:hypothetical protein
VSWSSANLAANAHVDGDGVHEHRYRIVVRGLIGDVARQAFEGLKAEQVGCNTLLRGDLDQAALFGALSRVQALGLELIEIIREEPPDPQVISGA